MVTHSFQRKEKKYFLTGTQMEHLLADLKAHMDLDQYCKNGKWYLIRNIYYDTADNHLIRLSTNKPSYKEKLRVRKYGTYGDQNPLYFLEIKKKINGIVSKRRVALKEEELQNLITDHRIPQKKNYLDHQILNEIAYFLTYRHVQPTLFLSYERLAFFAKENTSFRITFDRNIIARRHDFEWDHDQCEKELLEKDQYLMEVKVSQAMPLWFASLLSKYHIYPISFSKYGAEYKKEMQLKGATQYVH